MQGKPWSEAFGFRLLSQPRIRRLGVAMVLGPILVFRLFQFVRFTGEIQWGYDFAAYWRAGLHVLAGEPLYAAFQLAGPYPPQGIDELFLRPPVIAVLVTPLSAAFDSYQAANWVWAAIGAIALGVAVSLIARHEKLASGFDQLLLIGAAFAFGPSLGELILGNVDILLLCLLGAAWVAVGSKTAHGEFAAGALVGVAALLKVFPALVIFWFLLTGRYRAAGASVVAMAVIAIATLPVIGIQPWLDYPLVVLNLGPPYDLRDVLAPSVWLSELVPPTAAQVLVTIAAIGLVFWAGRNRAEPISFAVTVALSVLIAPALYPHYLSIMLLPLLLAMRYAPALGWIGLAAIFMNGFEPDALGESVSMISRVVPTIGAILVPVILIWFGRGYERASANS